MARFIQDLSRRGRIAVVKIRRNENLQSAKRKVSKFPNGLMAPLPAILSLIAWSLTVSSAMNCVFAWKTVEVTGRNPLGNQGDGVQLIEDHGVGLYGWESRGECHNYEINGQHPSFDGPFTTANCFTTFTVLLGGISMVISILGTVFPVEPRYYIFVGVATLVIACFSISALCFLSSNICHPTFFNYATQGVDLSDFTATSCSMARGSVLSLMASIFWYLAAGSILATNLSKLSRVPTPFRGAPLDHFGNDDHSSSGSEGDEFAPRTAYQKRQEELYLQRFGGADVNSITKPKPTPAEDKEAAKEGSPQGQSPSDEKPEEYEDEYDIGNNRRGSRQSLHLRDDERSNFDDDDDDDNSGGERRRSSTYSADFDMGTTDYGDDSSVSNEGSEKARLLTDNQDIV